ncbi:hypothetical protein HAX54_003057, partial [Datura stramonium]|nr:hypothetical protein [Datura stramonium]
NHDDIRMDKYIDMLRQVSLSIFFMEASKEMIGFAKYLKELVTKKRTLKDEDPTDDVEGYEEVVNFLEGLVYYFHKSKKLSFDLENRSIPLAKPTIEELPKLELNSLGNNLL